MPTFVSLKNLYVHFPTFRISYFFSVKSKCTYKITY